MEIIIEETYEGMSKRAAEDLLRLLAPIPMPLICVASGASPAGLYRELIHLVKSSGTDTSGWHFVGLDEWRGMNGSDEDSSCDQLNRQLFQPLAIGAQRVCFFDGRTEDPDAECGKTEAFIDKLGGIDVAILGIGVNGHIGMNEPGTPASLRSHLAAIHPSTQQIGQKYFKEPRRLDTGLTLGLANLHEAAHLMVLASGGSKAESIHGMVHAPQSEDLPATLLRDHRSLAVYLDRAAAERLG